MFVVKYKYDEADVYNVDFDTSEEAEEYIMEQAAMGAVIIKENGSSRSLAEIEAEELSNYEVIEK